MARLGPTGLTQVFVEIKNWVVSKLSSKANDSDVVHKSEDETITGIKVFNNSLVKTGSGNWGNILTLKNIGTIKNTAPDSDTFNNAIRFASSDYTGTYYTTEAEIAVQKLTTGDNRFTLAVSSNSNTSASGMASLSLYGNKTASWNGDFTATTFNGDLVGNVTGNATSATKATQDASGNVITDTYATKLYVDNEISGIVNSAPATLDTLNELASALGDDPNFATTIATQIGTKADNASVVHTTGDETVAGTKTFSSQINGNISGSSTSCTGNSVSATKLATGRTINIQDADGTNTGTAVTFNGTTNGVIKLPATIKATITGNADTANQFSANKSVTLTGDVTGTASSNAGWSVATTLANSGATAGTYGPTADVTGNNNATIVVPQITVDAKGRVTAVTTKTLTCKNNTYTVNDATLTIQKNGTTVKTFTANASSNVTANITVPTKTSELTNDTNYATTTNVANSLQEAKNYVGNATSNMVTTDTTQIIPGNKAFSGALDYLVPLSQSEIPTANTYTNFRFIG